jgi:hypothetical protein
LVPNIILAGGLEHFLYFSIYWEWSSQLTKSIIFQRGRYTTNQCNIVTHWILRWSSRSLFSSEAPRAESVNMASLFVAGVTWLPWWSMLNGKSPN